MMIPTPQLPLTATTLNVLTVLLALHLSTAGGSDCRSSCGNIPVDYPFGLSTRCGHPGFQNLLYCSNGELMFHIPSGSLYRVFDIDYAYPSLIISMSDCYSLSHSSSFSLSGGGDGGFFLLGRGSGSNAIRVSCLVPPDQDHRGSCRECEDAG